MSQDQTISIVKAELVFSCVEIQESIDFFTGQAGFRLDSIFPADDPRVAFLSGFGLNLRLERTEEAENENKLKLRIAGDERKLVVSPEGIKVEFSEPRVFQKISKPTLPADSEKPKSLSEWVGGRAGMKYRDLIPGRLGGFMIASQISIAEPGPVPDYVHFHDVGFQIIYCRKGGVKVVYEDQGEPFFMEEGDVVLQPPGIRHRVLESYGNTEVIEISSPAEHETFAEHELELPNLPGRQGKTYNGQNFVFDRKADAVWAEKNGFKLRCTEIFDASDEAIAFDILKAETGGILRTEEGEFAFLFVSSGACTVKTNDMEELKKGDSYIIVPGSRIELISLSKALEILLFRIPYEVPK